MDFCAASNVAGLQFLFLQHRGWWRGPVSPSRIQVTLGDLEQPGRQSVHAD